MRGACLFTNTLLSLKNYWLCGVIFFTLRRQSTSSDGHREDVAWVKTPALSHFIFLCLGVTWRFLRQEDKRRQSIFWSFMELLLSLIDHAPISIYRCRGQEHSIMPHLHAPPVAYTLVMTNGKGHTLALCIPHAASYPVMDSPPCHHHLLLGPGQNQ